MSNIINDFILLQIAIFTVSIHRISQDDTCGDYLHEAIQDYEHLYF